ncbi:uncharacterized protein PAC_11039 [Phialocephala subalpina]|uniref:Uncharacterized protein n=1 Tax=Phialocephala subalpina TaxID=576137 RepID=A0A1L7X7Z7_9HELO|nr:uncharacterized protein PAC_11039 [Phialocephala subalpina]
MAPHSLHRPWRFNEPIDASQTNAKKVGKPALEWTPSQERKLFRLVAKANVPWKYIAIAMEELEVPAEPGEPSRPAFTPGKSTCRTHWHEMTEIKPHKILSNPLARKKQREQIKIAFEAYQKRQSRLPDASSDTQGLSSLPQIPKLSWEDPPSALSAPTIAADIPTPQLTFEGTSPADFGSSVLTPESHYTIQPHISSDEVPRTGVGIQASPEAGSNELPQAVPNTGTKRRAPSEFDEVTHATFQKLSKQHSTASLGQGASQQYAHPTSTANAPSHPRVSTLEPVQEEPDRSNAPKVTIADVEDEMGVGRGFIAFVKYGLTRSRFSVQSVMSAASRISSRRSSRRLSIESKAREESDPFFYGQYMSDLSQSQSQSTQVQSQHLKPGRQETDLFLELKLAGPTDHEIAARIRTLLQECGPKATAQCIVRARNSRRETALEVALTLGNVPACEVLLEFGADVNAKAYDGKSLSAFSRAAERNATTSQKYFAIGACRNIIRSHAEAKEAKECPKGKPAAPKANKTSTANIGARLGPTTSSQGAASGPESLSTATAFPPPSNDQQQGGNVGQSHDPVHHRPLVFQESNMSHRPASPQRIPTLHVPNLVNYWNDVSDQQAGQAPRPTTTSQVQRPNTQLWNSYFPPEGALGIPALPGYDPRAGRWELLPGGRMAYVLDSFDAGASFSQGRMVPSRPPPPIPTSKPEMPFGMNQQTLPGQNGFAQSRQMNSMDTRRHGINPSTFANGLAMPSNKRGTIAGTMSNQLSTTSANPNAYDFQGYSSQANTLTNSWVNEMEFQPNFPTMDSTLPDTFESDVEDVVFDGLQNNNYVPNWDFQRPGF